MRYGSVSHIKLIRLKSDDYTNNAIASIKYKNKEDAVTLLALKYAHILPSHGPCFIDQHYKHCNRDDYKHLHNKVFVTNITIMTTPELLYKYFIKFDSINYLAIAWDELTGCIFAVVRFESNVGVTKALDTKIHMIGNGLNVSISIVFPQQESRKRKHVTNDIIQAKQLRLMSLRENEDNVIQDIIQYQTDSIMELKQQVQALKCDYEESEDNLTEIVNDSQLLRDEIKQLSLRLSRKNSQLTSILNNISTIITDNSFSYKDEYLRVIKALIRMTQSVSNLQSRGVQAISIKDASLLLSIVASDIFKS